MARKQRIPTSFLLGLGLLVGFAGCGDTYDSRLSNDDIAYWRYGSATATNTVTVTNTDTITNTVVNTSSTVTLTN